MSDDPPICSADGGPPSLKKVFVDHCCVANYIGLRMDTERLARKFGDMSASRQTEVERGAGSSDLPECGTAL